VTDGQGVTVVRTVPPDEVVFNIALDGGADIARGAARPDHRDVAAIIAQLGDFDQPLRGPERDVPMQNMRLESPASSLFF